MLERLVILADDQQVMVVVLLFTVVLAAMEAATAAATETHLGPGASLPGGKQSSSKYGCPLLCRTS